MPLRGSRRSARQILERDGQVVTGAKERLNAVLPKNIWGQAERFSFVLGPPSYRNSSAKLTVARKVSQVDLMASGSPTGAP